MWRVLDDDSVNLVADYVTCLELDPGLKNAAANGQSENLGTPESVSTSRDSLTSNPQSPYKQNSVKLPLDSGTAVLILDVLQLSIRKGDFDARSREVSCNSDLIST